MSTASAPLPSDLVTAVACEARRDADRLAAFLKAHGLRGSKRRPLALPRWFLLGLGLALRLQEWEQAGLEVHLHHGLPSSRNLLLALARHALSQSASTHPEAVDPLVALVLFVFARQMAWSGGAELQATMALGSVSNPDVFLEILANYLWRHRPY
ncbi:MAG: hypothetical protein ACKO23_08135 [Gemmataceae bacterium]